MGRGISARPPSPRPGLIAKKGFATNDNDDPAAGIDSISAVTLATHDMARACRFYEALGFVCVLGGAGTPFTTYRAGSGMLNLIEAEPGVRWSWWGRVIFYIRDVDRFYLHAIERGLRPEATPADASWGERYFQIIDPDGHELSFAMPLTANQG